MRIHRVSSPFEPLKPPLIAKEETMLTDQSAINAIIGLLILLFASTGYAEEPSIYNWPDSKAPVMVKNDSGAIFVANDLKPYRAFPWAAQSLGDGQMAYVADLDRDDKPELVGAGKPTFVLKTNADPLWSLENGCDQLIPANFNTDDKFEILCNNRYKLSLYTYDGQKIWSLSPGHRVGGCRAGDYNGDLKADLECKRSGQQTILRIDASGEILAKKAKKHELSEKNPAIQKAEHSAANNLDLSNYSSKKGALTLGSGKEKTKLETGDKPLAGLTAQLDGEGKSEYIIVTETSIFIFDASGKKQAEFNASADNYRRYPVAEIKSVYARGFPDQNKASQVIKDAKDGLAHCYAKQVKRKQLPGVGQLLLKLKIGKKGNLENINTLHSAVRDDAIETCAKNELQKLSFPAPKGKSAKINLNLHYSYRDK